LRAGRCEAGQEPARDGIRLIRGGWLRAFLRGAVTSYFVAIPECQAIRLHIRYRRDRTEERTREKQRAEKLLESAALKLSVWSPTCTE
jgi:hypothetical protein